MLFRALRQPRYAALSVLMIIVAGVCVAAGTWQIARLHTKATENSELRHNAHARTVPVATVLPVVGHGRAPGSHAIQFRTVTATGSFDEQHSALIRNRSVNGANGYLVMTPLRTPDGTLLVVRGFTQGASAGAAPALPAAPTGTVTVTGRLESGESRNDQAAHLSGRQLESINPTEQAARLGTAVFAGYAELDQDQPGVGTLTPMPEPDLSNPAGGAVEPQHLAYIIQWYLFALLALAAPVAMVRAETRERNGDHRPELDAEPAPAPAAAPPTPEQLRAAKLADRYGR